jgi:type IV pilus assembly protein PilV
MRMSNRYDSRAVIATLAGTHRVFAQLALSGAARIMPQSSRAHVRRAHGFSMVEALVALVIVSVGLLGVGGLTLTALRESSIALGRTRAVYLINDMMERIRANPDAEDAYDCAGYAGGPTEHGCAPSGAPARPCTARELAEDDLARWQTLARDGLSLVGTGNCDPRVMYLAAASDGEPARYRIELSWTERGSAAPITLSGELAVADGRSS